MHEKTYGKQKVYVFNQEQFPPLDDKQLKEMDNQVAQLTTSLREKERQLGEAEAQLKTLTATPTTKEAQDRMEKVYCSIFIALIFAFVTVIILLLLLLFV